VSLNGSVQAAPSQTPTASLRVSIAQANVRVPVGTLPTNLTARLNYADGAVALDQITGKVAGSDIGGRLIIGLSPTMSLDGDIKLGVVDVPAAIAAAVGMPAKRASDGVPWPADPFADGVFGEVKGRIAITSMRATLPPHLVAENLHGVLNFAPSEIALDAFGADIAGGQVSGRLAFERDGDELRVRSRVRLTKADMSALLRADSRPVAGRLNLDAEVEGRGRSPVAVIGSLQGKGFFSIEDGKFARLDPSAFDAVIRSVDQGLPIEVTRVRQSIEAALAAGTLSVEGDGAITAAAGKASLTALMLRAQGADLTVSARYDLVNDTLDATLTLLGAAGIGSGDIHRPQIALSLQGPIDSPRRTLDIAALVDWLSTRAAEENAKRLAAISTSLAARPAESTSPLATQPAVPANEAKAAASANLTKPESGRIAAVEPKAPGNPPADARPAGDDAFSATQPALPPPPVPAARGTAPIRLPGETNLARAEPLADPAIAELDRAISANPSDIAAVDRRGRLLALHGHYSSAIKDFDDVIRLRPLDAEAFNNRCWARAIIGDLQSALSDCNAALQLHPSYADAFDSRAMVNLKSGQPAKAVADYDAALRIDPKRANSLYGRGLAKIKADNVAGGNLDIAKAKSIQANIAEEFASYGIR
jgi:tetratricopeptide (TPR) repeat protein